MDQFGAQIKKDFYIEKDYVCVNHSSFGFVPKALIDYKFELTKRSYLNPDKFGRFEYAELLDEQREAAAQFLGGNKKQGFLTLNSAESFNSVIRNLQLTKNDVILYSNLAYPMIQNTIKFMNQHYGCQLIKIEFTKNDLNIQSILNKFEEQLKQQKIAVAVFENITALPSIKMPTKELINLCSKYGTISILDAAHGAGITEFNLNDLNPDFFFTNFNKWGFVPYGVNYLYMKEKYLDKIHHNTISVLYGAGIELEFQYNGTQERSNYLTISEGIKFINQFGLKNIIEYSQNIAWEGTQLVKQIWNTELLVDQQEMHSAMVNVRIPHDDIEYVKNCQKQCLFKYNVLVIFYEFDGKIWSRFSGSIYNTLDDYKYAAESFLKVLKNEE